MDSFCMEYLCNKVIDTEDERDFLLNLLGRVLILVEKDLSEGLSDREEVLLSEVIEEGFDVISEQMDRMAVELSNDQMREFRRPGWGRVR